MWRDIKRGKRRKNDDEEGRGCYRAIEDRQIVCEKWLEIQPVLLD